MLTTIKNPLVTNKILLLSFLLTITTIIFSQTNQLIEKYDTIIVLPDTQHYSEKFPNILCQQLIWIKANKQKLHIAFVSQLGDIVQNGGKVESEWINASNCFSIIDNIIPYSVVPGNHDAENLTDSAPSFTTYNKYFPPARYTKYSWYKGNYRLNQNNFELIPIGKTQLLFINLEVDPNDDVINWAHSVLETYPTTQAILITHSYLRDDDEKLSKIPAINLNGNSGNELWNKLIYQQCNIIITLSGHFHNSSGENSLISKNKCGKPVFQITQDYQDRVFGGNGLLRIYKYFPQSEKISVYTYSPYVHRYERNTSSEFTIHLRRGIITTSLSTRSIEIFNKLLNKITNIFSRL